MIFTTDHMHSNVLVVAVYLYKVNLNFVASLAFPASSCQHLLMLMSPEVVLFLLISSCFVAMNSLYV